MLALMIFSIMLKFFPLDASTQTDCDNPFIAPVVLAALPYQTDGLEPVISKAIVELHYTKHHQAYADNLNKILVSLDDAIKKGNQTSLVALQQGLKFNLGGFLNHNIYWENLAPVKVAQTKVLKNESFLLRELNVTWGNFSKFKNEFNAASNSLQGSGWVWLALDPTNKSLLIKTTANQDPLDIHNLKPLLGIDLWEHAYYLDYLNQRAKYVEEIWSIINWEVVESRYYTLMNITRLESKPAFCSKLGFYAFLQFMFMAFLLFLC